MAAVAVLPDSASSAYVSYLSAEVAMANPAKKQVRSRPLETPNVFLDTEVYRRFGHDLRKPQLQELKTYIREEQITLHTTDITLAEVERQIRERTVLAGTELDKFNNTTGRWRRLYPELVLPSPKFEAEAVAGRVYNDFQKSLFEDFGVRSHPAMEIPASEIFGDYFRRLPPFRTPNSKEFPDAFAVRALEKWCSQQDEKMYVVTADKAMREAVEAAPHLIPLPNVEALLEAVAILASPDVVERATKLLSPDHVQATLKSEIEKQISLLVPIYVGTDLPEGEATDHELAGEIRVGKFDVLASSSNEVRVLLRVKIPLLVTVEYEDRTYAMYDKEDDVYIGGESEVAEIETTPNVRVFVKLERGTPRVTEVRITTEEFSVDDAYEDFK